MSSQLTPLLSLIALCVVSVWTIALLKYVATIEQIALLIKAVGNLPNTFWGIAILLCSMYISVKYNSNIGYYFAGVGSTLVGIKQVADQHVTATSNPSKVEINTGKDNS